MQWRPGQFRFCRQRKSARSGPASRSRSSTRPPVRWNGQGHACCSKRRTLAGGERCFLEVLDQLVEDPITVDLGLEMHDPRPEPARGSINEHELTWRSDPAEPADIAVHALSHTGAVGPGSLLLDQSRAIFEQRAIDE